MTTTIGTLLAAHAAGKALTATIEETYDRIEKHNDPALFIAIRPKSEALAIAERVQASEPADKPLYGVPFVVKDNIDVAGLPTTAACPAFAYHPRNPHSSSRSSSVRARSSSARPTSTSLRPVSLASARPMGFRATRCVPISYLEDPVPARRPRSAPVLSRLPSAPTPRDRGACQRRLMALSGLKPSLGALSASGVVPACRTLDTISVFARDVADAFTVYQEACAFDERDAYSRSFPPPALSAFPSGFRLGVPRPDQRQFFDDANAVGGVFARHSARRIARRPDRRVRLRAIRRGRPGAL